MEQAKVLHHMDDIANSRSYLSAWFTYWVCPIRVGRLRKKAVEMNDSPSGSVEAPRRSDLDCN